MQPSRARPGVSPAPVMMQKGSLSFESQLHPMQPQQHPGPDSRVGVAGLVTVFGAEDTPPRPRGEARCH